MTAAGTTETICTQAPGLASASITTEYRRWLAGSRGLRFDSCDALWRRSVEQPAALWLAIWKCSDLRSEAPSAEVLRDACMRDARRVEGARLNNAQQVFRHARVLPAVYFGTGVLVWLFGRDSVHIGASGLVYGLVSYVFVAGLLRRDRRAIAASLMVVMLYGSLAWGVLPIQPRMSWETHLAAAVIGVLMALWLRRLDIPPRKRYEWEDETAGDDEGAAWSSSVSHADGDPNPKISQYRTSTNRGP